ncbi:peptidylprolyl isomerase [Pelagibacteraceae bacterium]|nr:peptidylprolyl isomerase [Pelagibacteraceae bacterium]
MKKTILTKLLFVLLININLESKANIENKIVAKVGNNIITQVDIENEVKLILLLSNQEINQKNVNEAKNTAIKMLVKRNIKSAEIYKYEISEYNKNDLESQIIRIAKNMNTDKAGLKEIFEKNNLQYNFFTNRIKNELLWNTLIYLIYKNQISINALEVENELSKSVKQESKFYEYLLSEIEIVYDEQNLQEKLSVIYESIEKEGFEAAVKKYSISTSSTNNGKIGWFEESSLSENYLREIKGIKKGEHTKPIRSIDSVMIIKLDDIKIKENKEVDIDKLKKNIISRKKQEKLDLFSRSHLSNIENSTLITFK